MVNILLAHTNSRSSIVKTFAMQALFDIAVRHHELWPVVQRHIEELTRIGTPAMKARGRKLLDQLNRLAKER